MRRLQTHVHQVRWSATYLPWCPGGFKDASREAAGPVLSRLASEMTVSAPVAGRTRPPPGRQHAAGASGCGIRVGDGIDRRDISLSENAGDHGLVTAHSDKSPAGDRATPRNLAGGPPASPPSLALLRHPGPPGRLRRNGRRRRRPATGTTPAIPPQAPGAPVSTGKPSSSPVSIAGASAAGQARRVTVWIMSWGAVAPVSRLAYQPEEKRAAVSARVIDPLRSTGGSRSTVTH